MSTLLSPTEAPQLSVSSLLSPTEAQTAVSVYCCHPLKTHSSQHLLCCHPLKLPWLSVSTLLSPTEDPTVVSSFRISMHQEHLISGPGQHSVDPASVITDVVVWTQKMQPSIQSMSGCKKCSPPSSHCLDAENAALHPAKCMDAGYTVFHLVNVWMQKMLPSIWSMSGSNLPYGHGSLPLLHISTSSHSGSLNIGRYLCLLFSTSVHTHTHTHTHNVSTKS